MQCNSLQDSIKSLADNHPYPCNHYILQITVCSETPLTPSSPLTNQQPPMAHDRYAPRRANSRKDSWLTIDWGTPGPPSAMQGVMDQIAGFIVRDPKLIDQGKREWRKAAAIREKKRRAGRGETTLRNTGNKVSKGSGSGAHTQKKSSSATKGKATGFLASLFRKKKPLARAPSSGAVRRALTKPGQQRSSSTPIPRRPAAGRRPTVARHQSARPARR